MLANINIMVILRMSFLFLNNADIKFVEQSEKLTWRSYIAKERLSTTNKVEFIIKREFAKGVLDENFETFVIYVLALEVSKIHPF